MAAKARLNRACVESETFFNYPLLSLLFLGRGCVWLAGNVKAKACLWRSQLKLCILRGL